MKKYFIGLDIGTSAIKGVLVSADKKIVSFSKRPFIYDRPEKGFVEIPGERYLNSCFSLLRELSSSVPVGGELCGVSSASASGNLIILGEKGVPSTPIFGWQDARVTNEVEKVFPDLDLDSYYEKVGWRFDKKTFPVGLLCYIKVHSPELIENCSMVAMSTEYLNFRLTGRWGISTSAGTPFYLIDQVKREYIKEITESLGIPLSKLPPIGKVGDAVGVVTAEGSSLSGLPVGTPVFLGTFDHPGAARGAGVLGEGQLLLSCGTSWVGLCPVKDRSRLIKAGMLVDPFLSEVGGPYAGLVSVESVSEGFERYVRRFVSDSNDAFSVFEKEASKSSMGAGGLVVDLRKEPDGSEAKRIEAFSKPDIARAIMEAAAILLKNKLDEMKACGISPSSAVMVGGPSENPTLVNVISEITGLNISVAHGAYTGAFGSCCSFLERPTFLSKKSRQKNFILG